MKVIIFGTNQLAELMCYHLEQDPKYEICAFTVHRKYYLNDKFLDYPVIPYEDILKNHKPEEYSMLVCVGYYRMNLARQEIYSEIKRNGYPIIGYIHPSAVILSNELGEGSIVMENVTIGLKCKIGEGNIFYSGVNVAHHTTIGDYNFFSVSCSVAGNVKIGNNCFFGNNCTIRNGISVYNRTLVGAAAYLDRNSEEDGVYVPPRTIKLEKKSFEIDLLK